MRSHAPDAAGPALRADGATFATRPSSLRQGSPRRGARHGDSRRCRINRVGPLRGRSGALRSSPRPGRACCRAF
ncbi:hypothetical protein FEF34_12950 [Streptomyces marianii]|uniref:Uncharacterized protein n=1 Tax=Streptomyces marianii TaxID=1817406 RepID=A0A5R9E4Z0_9ACTN|nr:hypothetical protein FEF34_12950 [Streptomyces marianii]